MSMEHFAVCDECGARVAFEAKHVDPWPNIPPGWWSVSAQPSANGIRDAKDDQVNGLVCSRPHAAQFLAKRLA